MPNPGGSTGHASNFIFPIEYSKMMMELTRDSTEQYQALGVFTQSGGIEVARTAERMAELRRRCSAAKAWGIPAAMLTPAEAGKLVPYLDESVILGGAHFPTVGVVDSLRAGTLMREQAQASGALTVLAGTEVLGIDTEDTGTRPRVRAVRTSAGDIETGICVICCGVWSPRIARMAGARLALTPIVHQMISVGPISLFAGTPGEIFYPIVRDVDTNMYERQHGGDMEVGSYAHRPMIVSPDDIPSNEEAALSPTEMPFTADDFDPQLGEALELMPDLLGDERAGIRYAINGLISMTPDGHPLLGEMPEVKGLWSAAASWIKEGPGCGRVVAELMSGRVPAVDVHEADVARFYPCQQTDCARAGAGPRGLQQDVRHRPPRRAVGVGPPAAGQPLLPARGRPGRGVLRDRGLGAPALVRLQRGAARALRGPARRAPGRMGRALVVADRQRRAPGHAGRVRPGRPVRLRGLRHHRPGGARRGAVAGRGAGRRPPRPGDLHLAAGSRGRVQGRPDRDAARRRALPGGHRRRDRHGREEVVHRSPASREAQLTDLTSAWTTLGSGGPAPGMCSSRSPWATCPTRRSGSAPAGRWRWVACPCSRRGSPTSGSWAGSFTRRWSRGPGCGTRSGTPAEPHGLVPVGIGVYGTTGRLEKGYRAFGNELTPEYNLVEAGMTRPRVKEQPFIGKDAYLAQRDSPPSAVLCTLTVDDHASADGQPRYMLGGEPILSADGERLVDSDGRPSYVTSAGAGPSVGKHLLMAYLPPQQAHEGTRLLVECFGERYPVTVAVAGSTPLFDPENSRVRS